MKAFVLCDPAIHESVSRLACAAGLDCLECFPDDSGVPDILLVVGVPIPESLAHIPALVAGSLETLGSALSPLRGDRPPRGGFSIAILDNLPAGVFVQRDGLFCHVNAAFASIFGYTAEEILGVLGPRDIVHPEDWSLVSRNITARISGLSEASRFSFRAVRKDGSVAHVELFASTSEIEGKTASVGVISDVSDRHEDEAAMRSRGRLTRDIIENLPLGITVRSPDGRILVFNKAWLRLWKLEEEEVERIERRYSNLSLSDRFPHLADHFAEVEEVFSKGGDLFLPEQQVQTPAGRRWISQRLYSVPDDAGRVGTVVFITDDVTERRSLAEEAGRVQKMENMTVLLGGIAHELNNLLTPISGYAEMALKSLDEDSPAKHTVRELSESSERACRQVRQLLAMSRRTITDPKPVDLTSLLNDFAALASKLLGESILLKTHLPGSPVFVTGDESELMNVFVNLALNSREAMPDGGMVTLRLMTDGSGKTAVVVFTDCGIGMDEEAVESALEPFYTTRAASGGAGLGLPTARAILKRHGGDLKLSSSLGIGTTLEIELPLGDSPVPITRTDFSSIPFRRGGRILIAEDDEAVLSFMKLSLTHAGYEVHCAMDGAEALRLLEAGLRPDCVVADVVMPHLDGKALLERILLLPGDIPVLFVSGYPVASSGLVEGERVFFLEKPFTSSRLLRSLDSALGRSPGEAAAGQG